MSAPRPAGDPAGGADRRAAAGRAEAGQRVGARSGRHQGARRQRLPGRPWRSARIDRHPRRAPLPGGAAISTGSNSTWPAMRSAARRGRLAAVPRPARPSQAAVDTPPCARPALIGARCPPAGAPQHSRQPDRLPDQPRTTLKGPPGSAASPQPAQRPSAGRSRGGSTFPTGLARPVMAYRAACNAPDPAHRPARGDAQGPPAGPPPPPLSSRPPARAGDP